MESLTEIEHELVNIFSADKKSWAEVYRLLTTVESKQLYKQDPRYRSFTSFVKGFAATNRIAESSIWRKYKASRIYANFVNQ